MQTGNRTINVFLTVLLFLITLSCQNKDPIILGEPLQVGKKYRQTSVMMMDTEIHLLDKIMTSKNQTRMQYHVNFISANEIHFQLKELNILAILPEGQQQKTFIPDGFDHTPLVITMTNEKTTIKNHEEFIKLAMENTRGVKMMIPQLFAAERLKNFVHPYLQREFQKRKIEPGATFTKTTKQQNQNVEMKVLFKDWRRYKGKEVAYLESELSPMTIQGQDKTPIKEMNMKVSSKIFLGKNRDFYEQNQVVNIDQMPKAEQAAIGLRKMKVTNKHFLSITLLK